MPQKRNDTEALDSLTDKNFEHTRAVESSMHTRPRKPPIVSVNGATIEKVPQAHREVVFDGKTISDEVVVALDESSENESYLTSQFT